MGKNKIRRTLVEFSVRRPKLVLLLVGAVTLLFMTQLPRMKTDTDPKNMLPATSGVRVWNGKVEKTFGLYEDTIVLGITNGKGVLNEGTLGRIKRITDGVLTLKGVAARDVSSFTTTDNVTVDGQTLKVGPLMTDVPKDSAGMGALRRDLFENPLFLNRIISGDGKATAIYIPLEKGANGKEIADRIREIVKREGGGGDSYYIAGDPVARDTFGAEMFKLMGVFSPIAGMVMFAVAFWMFRSFFLSFAIMVPAMVIIIWSMGLVIGLGYPIHIMSSMGPVFLMAIATDSIHIFNEFYFRYKEKKDRRAAILETMDAVAVPLIYTDVTTAVGFGSLTLANIIPVRVFGLGVGFGTIALLLLSFTLVPAILTFAGEERLERAALKEDAEAGRASGLLRRLAALGVHRPKTVAAAGLVLFVIAAIGTSKIIVNNNLIEWFKYHSAIRTADRVLNKSLGGTSPGYIVAMANDDDFIKTPEAMNYLEGLQHYLERKLPVVGKTASVADYVKRINRVLHNDNPAFDAIPGNKDTIGQYLFLFGMSAKPADLDNMVDYPFRRANIWVQLKTWDAQAMRDVIRAVGQYKKAHPIAMEFKPAGIAYFNLVWNDEVLWDMLKGFVTALVVVFIILAFNFRSFKWALIGYVPLLFTILVIYGVVGFTGKDFDMPISVLSTLSLGMAVDFAIHFVSRFKRRLFALKAGEDGAPGKEMIADSLLWTAARPGKGIMRNAVLFAAAFSVMLFAPLTPYVTVGAFIVGMMMLSSLLTIIYLPALITLLSGWLFEGGLSG
ncbi:MAG: MMPL family transporter [Nitrospiraceae bacterium]|nr:MMPL family transporter [Nitrospiraceae bacterium]